MQESTKHFWHFQLDRRRPLGLQIQNHIIDLIKQGLLAPGQQLCSQSKLANMLSVNKITIRRVYCELKIRKLIETRLREGSFVCEPLDDENGYRRRRFSSYAPFEFWQLSSSAHAFFNSYLILGNDAPEPGEVTIPMFRKMYNKVWEVFSFNNTNKALTVDNLNDVCVSLLKYRKIYVESSELALVQGELDTLQRVAKLLLTFGDTVVMTSAADSFALSTFTDIHANVRFTGSDMEGMLTDELEALCQNNRVKVVYVRPPADFPTRCMLSEARREHLLKLATLYDFVIIEMDEEHEFWNTEPPKPLIARCHADRVIYISPVSRMIYRLQALRIVVGPEDFITELRLAYSCRRRSRDHVAEVIISGMVSDHSIHRLAYKTAEHYLNVMDQVLAILRNYLDGHATWTLPKAGLTIPVHFNRPVFLSLALQKMERLGYFDRQKNPVIEECTPVYGLQVGISSLNLRKFEKALKAIRDVIASRPQILQLLLSVVYLQ